MLSIVIPTLNEEKNLEILLPKIKDYCNEIIIVDDGSTDNTIGVGKKYNCKYLNEKINLVLVLLLLMVLKLPLMIILLLLMVI